MRYEMQISHAQQLLDEEKQARASVQVTLEKQKEISAELRDRLKATRTQLRQEQHAKAAVTQQLEEASQNIGRLRTMLVSTTAPSDT